MKDCNLQYIPSRLHWGEKELLTSFQIGDVIYRRCKPEELENPYKDFSPLCEISHNLGTCCKTQISEEEDVLYSIIEDEDFEKYERVTYQLKIISLNEESRYSKVHFEVKNNVENIGRIELQHDPVACMYPHCIFRLWLNDEIVNRDNYKNGLGRLNKLRTEIRHELTTMVYRKEIDQKN